MNGDHEFAAFLKIIGRGPHLSRSLERDEARAAMQLVLDGRAEPLQIGAFLLLLRYRGETAAELAGMIEAARDSFPDTSPPLDTALSAQIDLDWPSYADRHRQQPWFVLAALLLARNSVKVLMHGIAGYSEGYAPTRPALDALGIVRCASLSDAAAQVNRAGIAYAGLETFSPALEALFGLRPLLGVRSAVNSLARALNPLNAPCQLQGVFHPPYRALHQDVAILENQPIAAVFKGGAGEVQRNPLKPCRVAWVRHGVTCEEDWPALLPGVEHRWREEPLGPERLLDLWRGEIELPAPQAAITGTVALALTALGRARTPAEAQDMAQDMWRERPKDAVGTAATASADRP